MLQPAENNLLVHPKTKYIGNISSLLKRSAIQNGSTVDPVEMVNIVGEVVAVPKRISSTPDYKGFSLWDIQAGDQAIFAYNVIYDFYQTETEDLFKNEIFWEGKELFQADIRKIFGYVRDEKITMLNGYVMATEFPEPKIVLPAHMKSTRKAARSQVISIGFPKEDEKPIDVYNSDWIYFNPNRAQHYQMNGKKFIIIHQSMILGKDLS